MGCQAFGGGGEGMPFAEPTCMSWLSLAASAHWGRCIPPPPLQRTLRTLPTPTGQQCGWTARELREVRKANFQSIRFTQHSRNDRLLGGVGGVAIKGLSCVLPMVVMTQSYPRGKTAASVVTVGRNEQVSCKVSGRILSSPELNHSGMLKKYSINAKGGTWRTF